MAAHCWSIGVIERLQQGRLLIDGKLWISRCERAVTWYRRMRGLLGRRELAADCAMLIEHCSAVHTVGMRFALDLIFLDRNDRVVKVITHVKPGCWMIWGGVGARRVVELSSNCVSSTAVAVGQRVTWERESV